MEICRPNRSRLRCARITAGSLRVTRLDTSACVGTCSRTLQRVESLVECKDESIAPLSLVTVSSLGYRDMHPVRSSNAIACIDFLKGMVHSGVSIAKVTARIISLHISRMCESFPPDFVDHISDHFERISDRIERCGSTYSTRYERINGDRDVRRKMELIRSIEDIVDTIDSHVRSLREYVNHELYRPDYFQKYPADSLVILGDRSAAMFFKLGQLLIGLSSQFQTNLCGGIAWRKISSANQKMLEISKIVSQHKGASDEPEVLRVFEGVGQVCSSIPITLRKLSQQCKPDQVIRDANDPMPVKDVDDGSETMGSSIGTMSHGGVQMHLNWTKCLGEFWCKLNCVNLEHAHFDYCRGVYIIWHGGRDPAVVYVGQGDIKARIQDHRNDPAIQRFEPHRLYVTWAEIPESSRDGVEAFLAQKWPPKVGTDHPSAEPIEVNTPWD